MVDTINNINEEKYAQHLVKQTRCWINAVIIAHNYCPFVKYEMDKGSIRYQVITDSDLKRCLERIIEECVWLDQNSETETTLLIFPSGFEKFDVYLDFLNLAEDLLISQAYEGIYQLASFHPDYCFQGAEPDDPANYTNRSPSPMLHLLREDSVQKVVENYPNPESIAERNIEFARTQGLEKMQSLLSQCLRKED